MRKDWWFSIGAVGLAFLASQHHALHMLLLALGLGGAGTSLMTAVPLARRAMLLMSLAMVVFTAYQLRDTTRPRSMRLLGALSIVATIALMAWSLAMFGP